MTSPPTPQQILSCPMIADNDSGASTVRGYLVELLATVWREEEGFSGKRPFGNSDWQWEVYASLVKAGLLDGSVKDGYLDDVDESAGAELILAAIRALGADR